MDRHRSYRRNNQTAQRYRKTGSPQSVAQSRTPALFRRLRRDGGSNIIEERRTGIAHLHRPWRAISEYAIGAECRRFSYLARPVASAVRLTIPVNCDDD